MDYEEFKAAWVLACRESGLHLWPSVEEQVDLRTMGRSFQQFVEPPMQDAEPFFVSAALSWRWSPIESARTYTNEESLLEALLGRKRAEKLRTEERLLRVDVVLKATLEYGKPLPLPSREQLAEWTEEVAVRLDEVERIVPDKTTRKNREGKLEVLAWTDEAPRLHVRTRPDGALVLDGVEIGAWQLITLPRRLDDSSRRGNKHPGAQLAAFLGRVRASLLAWMQATDHLRPRKPARKTRG